MMTGFYNRHYTNILFYLAKRQKKLIRKEIGRGKNISRKVNFEGVL